MLKIARGGTERVTLSHSTTEQALRILQNMQQTIDEVKQNPQQISHTTEE